MKSHTAPQLAGVYRLPRCAITAFCLFLVLLVLGPFAACEAQPKMITVSVVIIKGYQREQGKLTKLVRWPVEAVIHFDGKEYPVVQTADDDPSIRVPASYKPRVLKVTIKGKPDVKLQKIVTTSDSVTWDADATGSASVKLLTTGTIHLVYDMLGDPGTEKRQLPIIFLPGVAGTILNSGGMRAEVWPLTSAIGDRANLAFEPDGKTPARKSLITVGDILRRNPKMDFYGDFIESLKPHGYTEGQDLIPFPYDWRYSNDAHNDRLDQVINETLARTKQKKVILSAHSMGGIIARSYVYSSPQRAAKVDSLITMGTPFLGSPKVFYGLVNGYQFGNSFVRQELMKILMQNYAAAYQLLPQKPFIYDVSNGERLMSLDEVNAIRYKWFSNVQLMLAKDIYTSTEGNERFFNPGLLRQARQFMSEALEADGTAKPLPAGVKLYAIIGCGVSTLTSYRLEDWRPETSQDYLELGNRKVVLHPVSGDGDGTVPLWSLETPAATKTYYVPYERGLLSDASSAHGDLPANTTVQAIVAQIIKGTLPDTAQYPRPQQYMGQPITPGKVLEKLVEFELHSDAHLRISHPIGKALGFNKDGGIDESLPGTFLCMDDAEYASLGDLSLPMTATVSGIRDGKFTLDVKIKRPDGTTTPFSYREVPVKKGTVATVTLTPEQMVTAPPLRVTTAGKSTSVPATMGAAGGNAGGGIVISDNLPPAGETGGGATSGEIFPALDFALEIGQKDGKIVITSTANNPFAAILELRAGDRVLSIDGKSTDGLNVEQARALMRGGAAANPDMTLKVLRSTDGEQVTISMPRGKSNGAGSSNTTRSSPGGSPGGEGSTRTTGRVVSEADKKQAEQFMEKGMAFSTEGQWAQAEAEYRKALRLDPMREEGWIMLGEACEEQKKWPEAVVAYRELVKLAPDSGANHADLAHALFKQGKRAEAIREAREAIRLGEKEHPVFEELGLKTK